MEHGVIRLTRKLEYKGIGQVYNWPGENRTKRKSGAGPATELCNFLQIFDLTHCVTVEAHVLFLRPTHNNGQHWSQLIQ